MTDPTPEQTAEIRETHFPWRYGDLECCRNCRTEGNQVVRWPCDAARLLDALNQSALGEGYQVMEQVLRAEDAERERDDYAKALLNIAGTECVEWPACQPGDRCVSCIARDALDRHEEGDEAR